MENPGIIPGLHFLPCKNHLDAGVSALYFLRNAPMKIVTVKYTACNVRRFSQKRAEIRGKTS
jgi:hypothetical protein